MSARDMLTFFGQMSQTARHHTAFRLLRRVWPVVGALVVMLWPSAATLVAGPAGPSENASPTASSGDSQPSGDTTSQVSHLLTAMTVGATVANLARHHKRPFHAIEHIQWPFMVLFFILAGASFQVGRVAEIGWIGLAYLVLRVAGRTAGAWAGGTIGQADPQIRHWMGLAILPQAGVALGMALVATDSFPELRDVILPVVIGSTVLFELAGPLFTRLALMCSGDAGSRAS